MADDNDLIAAIYDAIIDPSGWDEVVKRIVEATKSVSGGLIVQQADAAHVSATHNIDPFMPMHMSRLSTSKPPCRRCERQSLQANSGPALTSPRPILSEPRHFSMNGSGRKDGPMSSPLVYLRGPKSFGHIGSPKIARCGLGGTEGMAAFWKPSRRI